MSEPRQALGIVLIPMTFRDFVIAQDIHPPISLEGYLPYHK